MSVGIHLSEKFSRNAEWDRNSEQKSKEKEEEIEAAAVVVGHWCFVSSLVVVRCGVGMWV